MTQNFDVGIFSHSVSKSSVGGLSLESFEFGVLLSKALWLSVLHPHISTFSMFYTSNVFISIKIRLVGYIC